MLRKLKKEVKLEKEKINDHMASWKIQLLRWNQQNMRDEQNGSPVNVVGVFWWPFIIQFIFFGSITLISIGEIFLPPLHVIWWDYQSRAVALHSSRKKEDL